MAKIFNETTNDKFFQSKYEAVDEAMISEIEAKTKDQITKATLIELWKKECIS